MKKILSLSCLLIYLLILVLHLHGNIGQIVFVNGEVEVLRDGEFLDEWRVDTGEGIENYDQIQTASDGEMIISLGSSEIHVAPQTSFVIDINRVRGKQRTTIHMMTGSLDLNIKKLTGEQDFQVKTDSVTMGVRGTRFIVQTSPAADLLISCEEGRVDCLDTETGEEFSAEPGTVIEKRFSERLQSLSVSVGQLAAFRRSWHDEGVERFKSNPLRVIRFFALRYRELLNRFEAEFRSLMARAEIINRWADEDRQRRPGDRARLMREKKIMIGHLLRIRRILFIFERVYHRLLALHSYYREGYGEGEIRPGLSVAVFYRRLLNQRKVIARKMARVRYIMKLYVKRNEGAFPLAEL